MYYLLSLTIAIVGLVLFFSPETLLSEDAPLTKKIYDNNKFFGVSLFALGTYFSYYCYGDEKCSSLHSSYSSTSTTSTSSELPSYEQAITSE